MTRQSRWVAAALLALPIWLLPFGASEGHGSGWKLDRAAECRILGCTDRPVARDLLDRVDRQVEAALTERAD